MKEIVTTSANFFAIINKGKVIPQIEIGITTSEVEYGMDFDGIKKSRKCETFRFMVSPEQLRKVSDDFEEYADECENEIEQKETA